MDFLDPKKRRSHRIRLFVGYGLIATALTFAATTLFYQATGYDIDRNTGEIIQNGLLFVDAHPESAKIFINGELKGRTGGRFVLPEGQYTVELRREGYHSWSRTFNLDGGKIERLVYPFLVPEKLESTNTHLYAAQPALASQSPDRRWVIIQNSTKPLEFDVFDLSPDEPFMRTAKLDPGLFSGNAETVSLKVVEWSNDNRHLLLRHDFEGGHEFVMVDHEDPKRSFNITSTYKDVQFTNVSLQDKKFDRFYLHDSESKRLFAAAYPDTELKLVTDGVLAYKSHGDNELIFVADTGQKDEVTVKIKTGDDIYDLRNLPVSANGYLLDIARYDDRWYMAVGAKSGKIIYIYENGFDAARDKSDIGPMPVALLRTDGEPRHLSFSSNTRFISVQSGREFAIFDAEFDKQYRFTVDEALPANQIASWIDGHRLAYVSQNKLYMIDYDGINKRQLSASYAAFKPFYDRDYSRLYTIGPSTAVEGRAEFLQTHMRITADR